MNLEKAIEILEALYDGRMSPSHPIRKDAVKLGIEALKRVESLRGYLFSARHPLLPGETKD